MNLWLRIALAATLVSSACSGAPNSVSSATVDVSAFQSEILSDGVVTFAEYEAAVTAEIACLELAGLEVEGPSLSSSGRTLDFAVIATADDRPEKEFEEAVDQVIDGCHVENSSEVVQAWLRQTTLSEEEIQVAFDDLVGCLTRSDVDVSGITGLQDLSEFLARDSGEDSLPESAIACIDVFIDLTLTAVLD